MSTDTALPESVRAEPGTISADVSSPASSAPPATDGATAPARNKRQGAALAGDLEQMPLVDLLQSSANSSRSGVITVHDESARGRLWLHGGRVHDALSEGTDRGRLEGRDAVFDLLGWSRGSFVVESGDPGVEDQIGESTSYLLLEGMRHLDEAERQIAPEHAGLPEEPPPPSRKKKVVHSGLLLLNVAASWVGQSLKEGLLAQRLRAARDDAEDAGDGDLLHHFEIDDDHAQVAWDGDFHALAEDDLEPLVQALAAWIRAFFERIERSLPGRYSVERLAEMTEAHRESLVELGYGPLLGWNEKESK